MKKSVFGTFIAISLVSQPVAAKRTLNLDARAAFRAAVEAYQMAVVPICKPDLVSAYVTARSSRDTSFVKSLRNTQLAGDYRQAVSDRAEKNKGMVFHCDGPPPPPPPASGPISIPVMPSKVEPSPDELTAHFEAGDRDFQRMVQLRDAALSTPVR